MMNGVLMTAGIDAISIPAVRAAEFNSRMVDFCTSRDATEMMAFVLDCHPEAAQIRRLNPNVSVFHGSSAIKYHRLSDATEQTSQNVQSWPSFFALQADTPDDFLENRNDFPAQERGAP